MISFNYRSLITNKKETKNWVLISFGKVMEIQFPSNCVFNESTSHIYAKLFLLSFIKEENYCTSIHVLEQNRNYFLITKQGS